MSEKKDKIRGAIGTIIFHSLLFAALLFLALRTPLPLPGEEGVEVNLGNSETGYGQVQPKVIEEAPAPPPVVEEKVVEKPSEEIVEEDPVEEQVMEEDIKEEIMEQVAEEAPVIKKPEKKKEEVKKEPVKKVEEKKVDIKPKEVPKEIPKVVEAEPEPEPVVNQKALYKGSSNTKTSGSSQGVTQGQGDQGKPTGSPESLKYDGLGGEGDGVSFSLGGRSAKVLPKPTYNSPEQGRVVVTIWVNQNGDVIRAVDGAKGTNISDLELRKMAREAALKAKFSIDKNAAETQKGTITYNFIRRN